MLENIELMLKKSRKIHNHCNFYETYTLFGTQPFAEGYEEEKITGK
jgi:hypothetical protein